ncbi:MAG: class I SAM-dependent methyltransferase [Candidatus Eisenbacteria bacterium]
MTDSRETPKKKDRAVLDEQIAYYKARASEYDEWFYREGRYDRGEEHRLAWFAEIEEVKRALHRAEPQGEILDLACGTGIWTAELEPFASRLIAVDASPETLALNRERLRSSRALYIAADLFSWTPPGRFDFVFFAFWLSHVPEERFGAFWDLVRGALRSGGRAFFVDSLFIQESTARDHAPLSRDGIVTRKLNDGRTYRIVKVFHEPDALERRLQALGWRGYVRRTEKFFLYGSLSPEPEKRTHKGKP